MQFPKQRIKFAKSVDGSISREGYLILDIKGLDIEGATSLVLEISDVDAARAAGDKASEASKRARELLGG